MNNMLDRLFNRKKKVPVLISGLNSSLRELGSGIVVNGKITHVGNRSCQVFGRYIDFSENGMKWLGVDCVKDIPEMARLLYYWLDLRLNSTEIELLVPGISFPESRKRMEEGEESFLNWYWQNLLDRRDRRFGRIIELFARHSKTRRLMSFTRLRDFGLSRIIPPDDSRNDLPFIRITEDWEYEVHAHFGILDSTSDKRMCLGKGNADEAFELLIAYLPGNLGIARYCQTESSQPAA